MRLKKNLLILCLTTHWLPATNVALPDVIVEELKTASQHQIFDSHAALLRCYNHYFEQKKQELMELFFDRTALHEQSWRDYVQSMRPSIIERCKNEHIFYKKKGIVLPPEHPLHALITTILQKFNLADSVELFLMPPPWAKRMAIACNTISLFIDPADFEHAPQKETEFFVTHEIQHIVGDDFVITTCMNNVLPPEQAEDFYQAWTYFKEIRADVFAALNDKEACRNAIRYFKNNAPWRLPKRHPHPLVRAAYCELILHQLEQLAACSTHAQDISYS